MKMRKILLLSFILMTYSCGEEVNNSIASERRAEVMDSIANPSIFIGEHKAKAMVLGVFHFQDANLDSYKPKFSFNILET